MDYLLGRNQQLIFDPAFCGIPDPRCNHSANDSFVRKPVVAKIWESDRFR